MGTGSRILNIIEFSKKYKDEFTKIITNENYKQTELKQRMNQEKLREFIKRDQNFDSICEKFYEDKVMGILSEQRFLKHSAKFEDEQLELRKKIKHLKEIVVQEKANEMNSNNFLKLTKKYENMTKLNFEILHEFIDKIIVHHREIINETRYQKIEVYYRFIGKIETPDAEKFDTLTTKEIFGKQGGYFGNENAKKDF
ncbi:MAG: DUF4368 domain-containing protei [Candidatus Improbicoccus pseudotrichonymphae]|uniref:DUF4368 domain-containing protei n=1 Tax=Candidatus Improbicoccus pseudotrichonymphae TaxID=3033792 RepID=A0AA48IGP2_9FIRM|nr:MAG: DUF4368 domain-containing protei [Candidatus Improbicoccus pseudotrichonymphae]